MTQSRAPLIFAIVLLLLPVLYVGSFYAIVDKQHASKIIVEIYPDGEYRGRDTPYRWHPEICEPIFYPLEVIDRRLRPERWEY